MVGLLDPAYLAVWKLMQQVALLSQKGRVMLRVIEYFAKSPKVTRNDTVECKSVSTETVCRTVSEISSIKECRDLETRGRACSM